jgi:anti-sigma regulatory factor (Ser/Thr protein kinase)
VDPARPDAAGTRGSAERELIRLVLRFSVLVRLLVVGVTSLTSAVTEPAREPVVTWFVVVAFCGWTAWYARMVDRGAPRWLLPADVVVVSLMCLAQVWTSVAAPSFDGTTWFLASVSIIVVAYQWHVGPVAGGVASVVVVAAYLAGAALAAPDTWTEAAPLGLWMVVEAGLSRGVFLLVRRGGRRADQMVAHEEQVRRAAAVAAARRTDEQEYLAALHDTASATLLMVGTGVVGRGEDWLRAQAARDLEVVGSAPERSDQPVDLVSWLRDTAAHVPLRVLWRTAGDARVPAVVAAALCHGTREALTNVVRHAGVDEATVSVRRDEDGSIVVEVSDDGAGFDPDHVTGHRYGVTRSLVARMARTGGRAHVTSRPGRGTAVRMEWCGA